MMCAPPRRMPFYFYLLMLAIKTQLPVLVALGVGLVEVVRRRKEAGASFLILMFLFWIVPFSLVSSKWLRWMLSWMPTVLHHRGNRLGEDISWTQASQ